MEANKILSAPLIDVIFDGRNKNYGAYELRKTYSNRTKRALSGTIAVVALVLWTVTMANNSSKRNDQVIISDAITLIDIADEKPPEKLPEPAPQQQPEPVEQIRFTPPEIVPDEDFDQPMPDQSDLDSAKISDIDVAGKKDSGFVSPPPGPPGDKIGVIDVKPKDEDVIVTDVDVAAKFDGDWKKFLLRNLNPQTPVDNGAPPGRYSVMIQFVVDKEGNVSDTKALTNHGYGLEEEAIRVLKKAPKWQPAYQKGFVVKAYHRQVIVFEVPEE